MSNVNKLGMLEGQHSPNIVSNIIAKERLNILVRGMLTLTPAEYRVVLAIMHGVSLIEYAKKINVSKSAVHNRYMGALIKLQDYVSKRD